MFHVKGVRTADEAASSGAASTKSVYAVLVGVSRLVADYRGVRKHPNVKFTVHPEAGANDGFLKVVVHTHNGCGIAAGSTVAADLGEAFSVSGGAQASPAAKRFKGVLDDVFKRQIEKGLASSARSSENDALGATALGATARGASGGDEE